MNARQTAWDRLTALPPVLTLPLLCRSQEWTAEQASVYVARWVKKGLLTLAGPRTGVYFNHVADPEAPANHRVSALLTIHPTAMLAGESVLHGAGWTTQTPTAVSVAVLARPTLPQVDGFTLLPRPRRWFLAQHAHRVAPEEAAWSTHGLFSLPPALALLDAYADARAWHPDPDDLDVDEAGRAEVVRWAHEGRGALPEPLRQAWGLATVAAPRRGLSR